MFGDNKKKIQKAIPFISELTGIAAGTLSAYLIDSRLPADLFNAYLRTT